MKPYYQHGKTYVCRVTGQSLGMSSNHNVQFSLTFLVIGTPDPENPDNYLTERKQYARTWYCTFTEKTMEWALEDLHALGFDGRDFGRLDLSHERAWNIRDQMIDMYCTHEPGKDREPVERWHVSRRKGGGETKRQSVTADKLSELDQMAARHTGPQKAQKQ